MFAVIFAVLIGWLPIYIAAIIGATLMVVTNCLAMEDAYRAIEWRAIFLIAGMLPLGTAMEQTGAARLIAEQTMALLGPFGPWWVIAGLYLITAAATMIIPTAALVVLMAPIVLSASADLGLAPETAMMAVAMAASASLRNCHCCIGLHVGCPGDELRAGVHGRNGRCRQRPRHHHDTHR
jgi:di/tricarboxylate transporter